MEQPGSAVSEIKSKAKQTAPPPEMEVIGIKLELLLKADCASRRDSRYAGKEAKDQQRLLAVVPVQPNVDSVVVHDDGGQRLPVPTYAPNNTFLPFASERPLTPADDESLNSLYALPACYSPLTHIERVAVTRLLRHWARTKNTVYLTLLHSVTDTRRHNMDLMAVPTYTPALLPHPRTACNFPIVLWPSLVSWAESVLLLP